MFKRSSSNVLNLSKSKSKSTNDQSFQDRTQQQSNPFAGRQQSGPNAVSQYKRKAPMPFTVNSNDDDWGDFQASKFQKPKEKQEKPTFIKPVKKRRLFEPSGHNANARAELLIDTVFRSTDEANNDIGKETCPYCGDILEPMTNSLRKYLEQKETKDRAHEQKQLARLKRENAQSSFGTADWIVEQRRVSTTDKHEFCKLHHIELVVKKQGNERGYPESIDFKGIEKRILGFKSQLDNVIDGKVKSKFKDIALNAYSEFGQSKARSAVNVLVRLENCVPGYYGPRGSAVITEVLSKLYLQSGILTKELTQPQLPLEYIQQVLMPEAGLRLIRQDLLNKSRRGHTSIFHALPIPPNLTETAEKVMTESREYGAAMFPEAEDESITIESDDSDGC
ncbi:hypothetical protein CU097_008141 [Rhizopus azygosporus]|uniref:Restriction of telomere capping protein 4 n=1 Tax=Rhizopus azygosporus TaxID=86630 RepID=A0A367JAK4_RHIAZ|nr:hypothetical protein CU097_008141 [Rhizopus azygosporus]